MKTLSLWKPHSQAISLSLKPYETRGWKTDYRGPLAIHAAKKVFTYKDYPIPYYQEVCLRLKRAGFPFYALDYGKVLCVVDLVDCVPTGKLRGRIGDCEFWGDFRDKGDDGKDRYAFQSGKCSIDSSAQEASGNRKARILQRTRKPHHI